MITKDKIQSVLTSLATNIENRVNEDHIERKSWNKMTGQYLVYGFEAKIGFDRAVELEAIVEQAFKEKKSVKEAVITLMTPWLKPEFR